MNKEDLWKVYKYQNYLVQNSDNKVMILLVLIGLLGVFMDKNLFYINMQQYTIYVFIVSMFYLTYFISIFYLFRAIYPNIKEYPSNIHFGSISKKDYQSYKEGLKSNKLNITEDLTRQVYISSRIVSGKFKSFKFSLVFFGISFVLYSIIKLIWLY